VLRRRGEEGEAGRDRPPGPAMMLECQLRGVGGCSVAAMHQAVHEGDRQPGPAERALVLDGLEDRHSLFGYFE